MGSRPVTGILPGGKCAEVYAAALQGQERFLQGGQCAAEALHVGPGDGPAVARLELGVFQAGVESWAFISSSVCT